VANTRPTTAKAATGRDIRLCLLLFSDLQLDRPYLWASPAIAEARRAAAKQSLVEILIQARQHAVDQYPVSRGTLVPMSGSAALLWGPGTLRQ
jgi:hypothetical protein